MRVCVCMERESLPLFQNSEKHPACCSQLLLPGEFRVSLWCRHHPLPPPPAPLSSGLAEKARLRRRSDFWGSFPASWCGVGRVTWSWPRWQPNGLDSHHACHLQGHPAPTASPGGARGCSHCWFALGPMRLSWGAVGASAGCSGAV